MREYFQEGAGMTYSKHRFEFFSDGVMAIIMTIMVIEIPVSGIVSTEQLGELFESILIFLISFFVVGWFWNKHHRLIDGVKTITDKIVWANLVFLFVVALLPLFTKWAILTPKIILAACSYSAVYLLANLAYLFLFRTVYHQVRLELPHGISAKVQKRPVNVRILFRYLTEGIILAGIFALGVVILQFTLALYILFPLAFSIILFIENKSTPV
jgi:uncharacterized membrane protein